MTAEANGSLTLTLSKLADMTDPSIFPCFSRKAETRITDFLLLGNVFQLLLDEADKIYNPSGRFWGLPQALLPVGHAWKLLSQLPPKMVESTSEKEKHLCCTFQHFGHCPDQQIKRSDSCVSSLLVQIGKKMCF